MNKIGIANILLTRVCNLQCEYCNIVKNYDDMPEDYPLMKYYAKNELDGNGWIEIIKRLKLNNPDVFLILYGGEPFKYPYLDEVVKYCNENDVAYTIISNNTDEVRPYIYQLYEELGPYRGFTSSVDPVALMPEEALKNHSHDFKYIVEKSKCGLANLAKMKADGIAEDVVAEITIMKESMPYLYETIKTLSDAGIYSSITAVDDQKTPYYDFSNVSVDEGTMLEPTEGVRELFDKLQAGAKSGELLIHIPNLLDDLFNILPSNMKCTLNEDVHNVTIEPDGSFRLCLRIKGTKVQRLSLDQLIDKDGDVVPELSMAMAEDYDLHCEGCNWTCPIMSGNHSDNIIDH